MVTTVSGAAWAIAGTANRQPAANATDAAARDCRPVILLHLVMSYPFGRSEICPGKGAAPGPGLAARGPGGTGPERLREDRPSPLAEVPRSSPRVSAGPRHTPPH